MRHAATVGLWVVLLAGLATAGRLGIRPLVEVTLSDPVLSAAGSVRPDWSTLATESLATHAVTRDAFRVARRPAPVPYDPRAAVSPETQLPRPTLSLLGIVWDGGADPTALLEGLPGTEGARAVRRGESVGDLRVRSIAPQHVVVVGLDTMWILTLRQPWQ